MASSVHGSLAPNVVTAEVVVPGAGGLVVINRSMIGAIWVRLDGEDPEAGGDDSFVVMGARDFPSTRRISVLSEIAPSWRESSAVPDPVTVKLLAAEALNYSVEAVG